MATKKTTTKKASKKTEVQEVNEEMIIPEYLQFNIEDEANKSYEDLIQEYQKQIDTYTEHLNGVDDADALKEDEKVIMKLQDDWAAVCHSKVYPIKKSITWHDKLITNKQIGAKVLAILEKYEVEYQATLGMYQMAAYWANPGDSITFDCMNSTSKILGETGIKYKGPKEWENILIINEYFKDNNAEYRKDNLKTIFYGCIHSAMVDRLQLITPVPTQGTQGGAEETTAPVEGPIEMVEQ